MNCTLQPCKSSRHIFRKNENIRRNDRDHNTALQIDVTLDHWRHTVSEAASGSGSGQVFGLALSKCLENERTRHQQAVELNAAVAASVAGNSAGDGPEEPQGALSRKSSHTGSHASFSSLAEGAKQVMQLIERMEFLRCSVYWTNSDF